MTDGLSVFSQPLHSPRGGEVRCTKFLIDIRFQMDFTIFQSSTIQWQP